MPAASSAILAWSRTPSPSPTLGLSGPWRTTRLPTASIPEPAQRTTWPQNRWWTSSPTRNRQRQVALVPTQSTLPSP